MVSLIVPHLLFQGLVIWQRCFSGWRGNTWASFRPPAHLISTHISSLTPEFTMIHSKWIYFQRFIYNCVNKSVSRSAFWCLPFIWYRHRAQNKCALLVSLLQEKMSNSGEKLNLKQLAGRATQSSSYPLPLCGLMTLFCFCFVQIKACQVASWLMGEKKWLIAKKQWKIRKHTQNFKTFFFIFRGHRGKAFQVLPLRFIIKYSLYYTELFRCAICNNMFLFGDEGHRCCWILT